MTDRHRRRRLVTDLLCSVAFAFILVGVTFSASAEGTPGGAAGLTGPPRPNADAPPFTSTAPPTVDVGYGWYTLAADGVALAVAATQVIARPSGEALGYVAAGTFVIGAPLVHVYHQHVDKALLSAGLRIGLPFVIGGAAAAILASGRDESDTWGKMGAALGGAAVGATIGAVGASVIDATLIARERVPAAQRQEVVGSVTGWVPTVSILPHGAAIGVQGTLF